MIGMASKNKHTGSSFDTFLEEEGLRDDVEADALKRVLIWHLEQQMQAKRITKTALAARLGTSRTQLGRLLDPGAASVQLDTMARAARAVGLRLKLSVEAAPAKSRRVLKSAA
jgi:DNA-binding phage protein